MKEIRATFLYGLKYRIGDEPRTAETHANFGTRFRVLPRKNRRIGRRISQNDTSKKET